MSYTIIKDSAIEPFHISKDQHCYTVYETITPETKNLSKGSKGKNYEKALSHHGNLGSALKSIAKNKTNTDKTYNSIQEYITEYQNIHEEISQTFNLEI